VSLENNLMVIFSKWLTEVPVHCAPTLWSLHMLT